MTTYFSTFQGSVQLGHAKYSTTADIYSHLDYSSKVQSANAIANALDMSDKSEPDYAKRAAERERFTRILKEMAELGFDDIGDYFDYLDGFNKLSIETKNNNNKTVQNYEM